MKSRTTSRFWDCYERLPQNIQERSQKAYALFKDNPQHPSLRFKKVLDNPEIYSVIWFWIGSHGDYEELLKRI